MDFEFLRKTNKVEKEKRVELVEFLYQHLDEFGDSREDIMKAVNYSLGNGDGLNVSEPYGGFCLISRENGSIKGAVVINQTGMNGYIPENILVYIAVHRDMRGKGLGKELINKALEKADGNVALHVEPHNPARFLYEKIGFSSKYLEMRYEKAN